MRTHLYRNCQRLASLLLAAGTAGLGTGCQTAKLDYVFRPQPRQAVVSAPAVQLTAVSVPPRQHLTLRPAAAALPAPRVSAAARQPGPNSGRPRRATVAAGAIVSPQAVVHRAQQRLLRRSPQAPAEQGLGLTVFGLLGMVAVVVGLVGLLISGGLGWAVVAGLGAVAVLLAWLIPRAQR